MGRFLFLAFAILFWAKTSFALIGTKYLEPNEIIRNLCMIRAGYSYSSCVIIGRQTVLTTSHTFAQEAQALKKDRRFELVTYYGSVKAKAVPHFFDSTHIAVNPITREDSDSAVDLVVFDVPELIDLEVQHLNVAGLEPNLREDDFLAAMWAENNCRFHGVGNRLSPDQYVNASAGHAVMAPGFRGMNIPNPLVLKGMGVGAAPADSGGAYTCRNTNTGEEILIGLIATGSSEVLKINVGDLPERGARLQDQPITSQVLSLSDPKISQWLKDTICQWESESNFCQ